MDKLHPRFSHPTQLLWSQRLPSKHQLIYPIFVVNGEKQKQPIASMPNIFRHSVDMLDELLAPLISKGLRAVLIFGVVEKDLKDDMGSYAGGLGKTSCVHDALSYLRGKYPQLLLIADVCLCAYTSHGHCGVLTADGYLDNELSIQRLA